MSPKNEVIDDSTDPGDFEYCINLPAVDLHSPIAIFDLFFTPENMYILVENTNKNGTFHAMGPRNAQSLEWRDTFVEELYAYLGILIYMGLHSENDIDQYWCIDTDNQPSHKPVRTAMARDRWKQISQAFYISERGQATFQKVEPLNSFLKTSFSLSDYKEVRRFRTDLQKELLARGVRIPLKRPQALETSLDPEIQHRELISGSPQRYCSICTDPPSRKRKRVVLSDISGNCRSTDAQKRRKTTFEHKKCGVPTCKDNGCFARHCNTTNIS